MADAGVILALNSGSSSLKVACFRRDGANEALILTGSADHIGRKEGSLQLRSAAGASLLAQQHLSESQDKALEHLAAALRDQLPAPPIAIGHRIVHGGPDLREHQRITPDLLTKLEAAVHLAPLHLPEALRLIHKSMQLYPGVTQFACFDTTFHRNMPDVATYLPIPIRFFAQGVQRYGFHGLSCESVMRRLVPNTPARLIIAHLGNGSSVTAVRDGRSIDTSMGLSPTGGVPMGTRTGDLDPGVFLYLQRNEGLSAEALEQFINHDCGLAGLSGGESDMQLLLQHASDGNTAAALAIEVFCTDIRKAIGSYAALLGGLDLLVFTGGIGEHSAEIRNRIVEGLDFLFRASAQGNVTVLPAMEEAEIAYHCRKLLTDTDLQDGTDVGSPSDQRRYSRNPVKIR